MAKLTDLQRKEILAKRLSGEKLQTIADQYGVTKAYISILCKKNNQLMGGIVRDVQTLYIS